MQETSPLKKYVLMNLLRYCDLMRLVPFEKVTSLTSITTRWNTIPDVAFRKIGGTYSESTGTLEQVSEGVYGLGGEVKVDRVYQFIKNVIKDPEQTAIEQKTRSIGFKFNDVLINGDHATDVDSPEGLNKRIASYLPSRQSIATATAAFDVTASNANMNTFIDKMHELVDLAGLRSAPTVMVKKGDKQPAKTGAILMNRNAYLGFGKVLRRVSPALLQTTQDSYGRIFESFAGVPLVDAGLKADKSTEIIGNTYGASSNETRIFAVRFGSDDGFTGIQLNGPEPYDPIKAGEGAGNTSGPQKLKRIDWWMGFAGEGSYYAARLTGVLSPASWT